jgi:hypothetical protein
MLASAIPSVSRLDRRSQLKAAIEREKSDARIGYSEREQARPKVTVDSYEF